MGVKIDGPFGSFTLHRDASRAAVFVAGGIGITPFRSIYLSPPRLPFRTPAESVQFYQWMDEHTGTLAKIS